MRWCPLHNSLASLCGGPHDKRDVPGAVLSAPSIPPVIVTVPADLKGGIEVLVRHQPWGDVEVDVRAAGTSQSWTPIGLAGGKFTVRAAYMSDLRREIAAALNKVSAENGSNTPDFVLADYLDGCLTAFNKAVNRRQEYGDANNGPGQGGAA